MDPSPTAGANFSPEQFPHDAVDGDLDFNALLDWAGHEQGSEPQAVNAPNPALAFASLTEEPEAKRLRPSTARPTPSHPTDPTLPLGLVEDSVLPDIDLNLFDMDDLPDINVQATAAAQTGGAGAAKAKGRPPGRPRKNAAADSRDQGAAVKAATHRKRASAKAQNAAAMDVCAPPLPVGRMPATQGARLADKRKRHEGPGGRSLPQAVPIPGGGASVDLQMMAPPPHLLGPAFYPGLSAPSGRLATSLAFPPPPPPPPPMNFLVGGAGTGAQPALVPGSVTSATGFASLATLAPGSLPAALPGAFSDAPSAAPPSAPGAPGREGGPSRLPPGAEALHTKSNHPLRNEVWYPEAQESERAHEGDEAVNPFRLPGGYPVSTVAGQAFASTCRSPVNPVVAATADRLKDARLKSAVRALAIEEVLQCCERMGFMWGRVKGFPFWPCQVLKLDDSQLARYGLTAVRKSQGALPVMYFGTDMFANPEVSWLSGEDIVGWRLGMEKGYCAKAAGNRRLGNSVFQLLDYLGIIVRVVEPPAATEDAQLAPEANPDPTGVAAADAAPEMAAAAEPKQLATEDGGAEAIAAAAGPSSVPAPAPDPATQMLMAEEEAALPSPPPTEPPKPAVKPERPVLIVSGAGGRGKGPQEFEVVVLYPKVPPKWWELRVPLLPWSPEAPPREPTPEPPPAKEKKKGRKKGKAEGSDDERENSNDKAGTSARQLRHARWPPGNPLLPSEPEEFALPVSIKSLPKHPPKYETVRRNLYAEVPAPRRRHRDEVDVCNCRPEDGCGDGCINRMSNILCDPKTCPAGDQCTNGPFQKRKLPRTEVYLTENRGWGAKALEPIQRGAFVCEYVGEVVSGATANQRIQEAKSAGDPNFYIMDLGADRLIDAKRKGGIARFLNSSCDPNCETQKWTDAASEEVRVGLFALRDIAPGEELTYDYRFEHSGTESMAYAFRCLCGAPNCRGTMDVNPERQKNLGRRVEVRWDDGRWYRGTITGFSKTKNTYTLLYDDNDIENVDLKEVGYRFLHHSAPQRPQPPVQAEDPEEFARYEREVEALLEKDQDLDGKRVVTREEDEARMKNLELLATAHVQVTVGAAGAGPSAGEGAAVAMGRVEEAKVPATVVPEDVGASTEPGSVPVPAELVTGME